MTGQKGHYTCFFNDEHFLDVLEQLLNRIGIKISEIKKVWGLSDDADEGSYGLKGFENYFYHSVAHIFSAVLMNTDIFYNGEILGFCVDGGPDILYNTAQRRNSYYFLGCYIKNGVIKTFPVSSPGFMWMQAKRRFKKQEGTLMALATASKSELYLDSLEICDLSYYKWKDCGKISNFINALSEKVNKLTLADEGVLFNCFDKRFSVEENKISMVMKIIQKISLNMMESNVRIAINQYNINPSNVHLAMSGGYGLNCATNSFLMKTFNFKGFLAPPCINDGGIALGKGLYKFYKEDNKIQFHFKKAFYGDSEYSLYKVISENNFDDYIDSISDYKIEKAINDIIQSPIVWFNSRAEIGPRALGNRSLLGDPRNIKTKNKLNKIKQREWWRPVAPIILDTEVKKWFYDSYESPYMLHTFEIIQEKMDIVPAICHLDNSSRIQTVNKDDNSDLYDLLEKFYEITDVPILCNTSLNDKGEPIINSISEAINFALVKHIEIIYINKQRIKLKNFDKYTPTYKRFISLKKFSDENERQQLLRKVNPYDVPIDEMLKYPNLFHLGNIATIDLTNESNANSIKQLVNQLTKKVQ